MEYLWLESDGHNVIIMFQQILFIFLYCILLNFVLRSIMGNRRRIYKDSFAISSTSHRSQIYQRIAGTYHINIPIHIILTHNPMPSATNASCTIQSSTTLFDIFSDTLCTLSTIVTLQVEMTKESSSA